MLILCLQNGQANSHWVDGSPHAFQMWKESEASTLGVETVKAGYSFSSDQHAVFNRDLRKGFSTKTFQRHIACDQCIDYIEPHPDPNVKCSAALMIAGDTVEWIKVPCTEKHNYIGHICEIHPPSTSQKATAQRTRYSECPPRAIHLSDTCIWVYTSVWETLQDISTICTVQNATLYHIPRFLAFHNPLWYTEREIYFVGFLQAMNHRWPGLADYESAHRDNLLMANVNSTELVSFRFSLTNLSHFEIDYGHGSDEGTGAVHVVCEFPLLSISSDCLSGHFSCYDGTCILEHYVCDGVIDCPDNTDEFDCGHVCNFSAETNATKRKDYCFSSCVSPDCICSDLYFHCKLGGCIPWSRVCDGVNDCPSHEDEHVCEFYYLDSSSLTYITQKSDTLHFEDGNGTFSKEFHCRVGNAILLTLKNDLVPDCLDQSDEDEYHNFLKKWSKTTYSSNTSLCQGSEETTCVQNFPGVCYPRHRYCIHEIHQFGTVGCRNGGHLSNCQNHTCPSQFKCPDAYCVSVHSICDGKQDCPNGDDEMNCQSLSCPGYLLCRHDNVCVHPYDIRSDHIKCPKSTDDKALTNVPRCPPHCSCLGYAISCKFSGVGDFPRLPAALRLLLFNNVRIDINNIKFTEGIIFLLHLQITNASLYQLQQEHISSFLFLKNLNLSYNSLKSLGPRTFLTLHNLEIIDLSHNLLEALRHEIFTGLRVLRQLNLNHNSIKLISHCTFQHLQILGTLNLSHNKLSHLGKIFYVG